jgi:two-component system sensor histidine kinase QseC
MTSIRIFLTLSVSALILLVSFMSAIRGYRESMVEAELLFDQQLLEHAKMLSLLNPSALSGGLRVVQDLVLPNVANPELGDEMQIVYQIFTEQGGMILRSVLAPVTPMSPFEVGYREVNFGGYRWRVLAILDEQQSHWVLTAQRIDIRYDLAEGIILDAVVPTIVSVPLAAVLIWLFVSFGLRPLQTLARQVQTREASDLSPVRLDQVPRELTQLTRSINDLLRRLQGSFEREKRFAADAAHELRTPISVLKVQVHNLLQELQAPAAKASARELREGIDAMGHLVEQILELNRTAPDQYSMRFQPLDLHALAQEVVSQDFDQILQRGQEFELEGESCTVPGDATALRSLLHNLLTNASKYTPEGGRLRLRVAADEQGAHCSMDDSGPGIPEQYRARVFDRFYRLHGDQHDSGVSGSGLGLAIVKHIIDMHHASIELGRSDLGGLRVLVRFPAATGGNKAGLPEEAA